MKAVCYITYCSKEKKKSARPLSALERYQSPRIHQVHDEAERDGADFRILSGRFGLIRGDERIPWYDHLLQSSEVGKMVERVAQGLAGYREAVFFYREGDYIEPYAETMRRAAESGKIRFRMQPIRIEGG